MSTAELCAAEINATEPSAPTRRNFVRHGIECLYGCASLDTEEIVVMSEPNLQSIAFPILDDAQIAELGQCTAAKLRSYKDGQTLVQVGQRDFHLFIVKSG